MKRVICLLSSLLVSVTAQAGVFGDSKTKKEMQRRVQERMEAQFKKADVNNDGFLTREEAEKNMPYIHQKFDLMDIDKDGKLTIKEISAHNEVAAANQGGKEDAPAEPAETKEGKDAKPAKPAK